MNLGRLGIWAYLDTMSARETVEFARRIEKLGFSTLWIPEAVGRDPFSHAAFMLAKTEQLIVATGIANIWARDPVEMAAAAKTVSELSDNRFVNGIGVSHAPLVDGVREQKYTKPYSYMRQYLARMKSAPYDAKSLPEATPILLAALLPRMLKLAATEALGTHTFLAPPEHTAQARALMGPKPLICAAQIVILENDTSKARIVAREYMKFYIPRLPNYTTMLGRLGYGEEDIANGCSDRLIDAVIAWGSRDRIRERIGAQFAAGANHVCVMPLRTDGEPRPDDHAIEILA